MLQFTTKILLTSLFSAVCIYHDFVWWLQLTTHVGNGDVAPYARYTATDSAALLAHQNEENYSRVLQLRQQQDNQHTVHNYSALLITMLDISIYTTCHDTFSISLALQHHFKITGYNGSMVVLMVFSYPNSIIIQESSISHVIAAKICIQLTLLCIANCYNCDDIFT